jgi:DNA-binding PadR family transcriptional regulator
VAELARECQLDTGAMTRLLDRLEAKGLCRRVRSWPIARVVNIELTDEGRAAAEEVPHVLSRVQNEHLAGFTNEEWAQLKSYLRRILDNAQALSARGEKDDQLLPEGACAMRLQWQPQRSRWSLPAVPTWAISLRMRSFATQSRSASPLRRHTGSACRQRRGPDDR